MYVQDVYVFRSVTERGVRHHYVKTSELTVATISIQIYLQNGKN